MKFIGQSYHRQAAHFDKDLMDEERQAIAASWFDESTADFWRHARMYECADCLSDFPDANWLTVGDGRWGLDSIRLKKKGFKNVLPSDISEALLKESKKRGYIQTYSIQNAESLTFDDNSFDYVLCKESFHHFPRPYMALYELLRVARFAVFLIEPNDPHPSLESILEYVTSMQKDGRCDFPRHNPDNWEGSGNFVYSISRREIEKVALGLNLPQLVFKPLNDHYVKGCEFEPADIEKSAVFREIVETIKLLDKRCQLGQEDSKLLMTGIFKEKMRARTKQIFISRGWSVTDLPRNPYI